MAHDMHFLPYVSVTIQRISWLIAKCGSVVDQYVNPRALRTSLVLNMVTGGVLGDRAPDHTLMNQTGGWIHSEGNATLVHYFSSVGAAGPLATLVRHPAAPVAQRTHAKMSAHRARVARG